MKWLFSTAAASVWCVVQGEANVGKAAVSEVRVFRLRREKGESSLPLAAKSRLDGLPSLDWMGGEVELEALL